MNPELLPGRGVERDQRVVAADEVHHLVHDNRVESGRRIRVGPRDLELIDVRLVDLIEVDEVRTVGAGEVVMAVAVIAFSVAGSTRHTERRRSP